jgi:uncharacterized membrane protein YraQ (UPF0718 family)
MPQPNRVDLRDRLTASARQTLFMTASLLPILIGVVLLTGLLLEFLPAETMAEWFGRSDVLDAFVGALAGGVASGHPLTSYVLGGELLERGLSLIAVTAFLISWVTVGSVQLPAEMLMLGRRFALYRNLLCFGLAILLAALTPTTLRLLHLVP